MSRIIFIKMHLTFNAKRKKQFFFVVSKLLKFRKIICIKFNQKKHERLHKSIH